MQTIKLICLNNYFNKYIMSIHQLKKYKNRETGHIHRITQTAYLRRKDTTYKGFVEVKEEEEIKLKEVKPAPEVKSEKIEIKFKEPIEPKKTTRKSK